jgi:hypothetical protein
VICPHLVVCVKTLLGVWIHASVYTHDPRALFSLTVELSKRLHLYRVFLCDGVNLGVTLSDVVSRPLAALGVPFHSLQGQASRGFFGCYLFRENNALLETGGPLSLILSGLSSHSPFLSLSLVVAVPFAYSSCLPASTNLAHTVNASCTVLSHAGGIVGRGVVALDGHGGLCARAIHRSLSRCCASPLSPRFSQHARRLPTL